MGLSEYFPCFGLFITDRKLPKETTLITFGISSHWSSLLSGWGGCYFGGVVTYREQKMLIYEVDIVTDYDMKLMQLSAFFKIKDKNL